MDKAVMVAGIFAILAIVGIVFIVNTSMTGKFYYQYNNIYATDFYVKPTGMKMDVVSGVSFLRPEQIINNVCMNTVFCTGKSSYVCCKHDGTECIVPSEAYQQANACPLTHRGRCLCREDYIAALVERHS